MTSLRQHFQRIKEIVDWSWTLALLCLVGYITLGQLVQLYWAMLFLGGVAGSFGLFYEFSCQKLVELDAFDTYELQKFQVSATEAQVILRKFSNRNPQIPKQYFSRVKQQVDKTREKSFGIFQERVNEQRQAVKQRTPQPPPEKQVSPQSPRQTPSTSAQVSKATKEKLTLGEYKRISNQTDYEFVQSYRKKNGTSVEGYYRRKRRK